MGAQDIGTLVHEVAHDLGDTDAATYAAELEARWGRLGLAPGWLSRRDLVRAQSMTTRLARYVGEADAAGWRKAASEERIRVALGLAVVAGQVDRVEVDAGGRVRVVDLKTGASKPTLDEVPRHGERSGGAALLQLGRAAAAKSTSLQLQPPLELDDEPAWARELVEEVADGMAGAVFAATPGPQCGTCQVKDSCPAYAEGRRL